MSYLILDDPKLIYFLTSNPFRGFPSGMIAVKGPDWALPAKWPFVPDSVRDEATRPLPMRAERNRQQLEIYRRGLGPKPRPYA